MLTSKAPSSRATPAKAGDGVPVQASLQRTRSKGNWPSSHPNRWPHILKTLGFRPAFRYEKYRTSLRLGRLHVDLDETPVGGFLELEGAPEAIESTARALGYARRDYLRATYWDLYAADCKRRGRAIENMVFRYVKKIVETSSLCLTKFPSAFTSQVEDIRILMEASPNSEPGSNSPAEMRHSGWGRLFCRLFSSTTSRAVADREARPGLK